MVEDWDVLLSFLPRDWRELARDTGALKTLHPCPGMQKRADPG